MNQSWYINTWLYSNTLRKQNHCFKSMYISCMSKGDDDDDGDEEEEEEEEEDRSIFPFSVWA